MYGSNFSQNLWKSNNEYPKYVTQNEGFWKNWKNHSMKNVDQKTFA